MIRGLFETHINVRDLERSIEFYCCVLGLQLARLEGDRRVAFIWLDGLRDSMLGLWERPGEKVVSQHFAFRASVEDVVNNSVTWLKARNLRCRNFLKDGTERPMVFCWVPAVAIYFPDPDGHSLELIATLPGKPRPELGCVSWEEWNAVTAHAG